MDGSTVVVGATGDGDDGGSGSGSAYVFRMTDVGATHGQVAKLTAADPDAVDKFGLTVAIAGDTVVIGAYKDDDAGSGSGSAYIFRTTDDWDTHVEIKLTAADAAAGDTFGQSVAMDGGTVVVGATKAGTGGAVYFFRTIDGGTTYDQVAKLSADDAAASDKFGFSVAIDGDRVVVGATGAGTGGGVYFFQMSDDGATSDQVAKLSAADAANDDGFGWSVDIDGDTVVVGAVGNDDAGTDDSTDSGSAYVFLTSDGGATYDQVAKLTAADTAAGDSFGNSVVIASDKVVVGAWYKDSFTGSAYVFALAASSPAPTAAPIASRHFESDNIVASDGAAGDWFGVSAAVDGDVLAVSAPIHNGYKGAVYVSRTSDGGVTYVEAAALTHPEYADGTCAATCGGANTCDDYSAPATPARS